MSKQEPPHDPKPIATWKTFGAMIACMILFVPVVLLAMLPIVLFWVLLLGPPLAILSAAIIYTARALGA